MDPTARIGTTLKGKWRIDRLLGTGGFASVYAATHRAGKRVAIKVLHAALGASEDVRRRFLMHIPANLATRSGSTWPPVPGTWPPVPEHLATIGAKRRSGFRAGRLGGGAPVPEHLATIGAKRRSGFRAGRLGGGAPVPEHLATIGAKRRLLDGGGERWSMGHG